MAAHGSRADEPAASVELRRDFAEALKLAIRESARSVSRLGIGLVVLSSLLVVVLAYQTLLLARLNSQVVAQSMVLESQSSLLREQAERLRSQNMLLQEEVALLAERNRRMADQNRTLQHQSTLMQEQNRQLNTTNRLIRARVKQLARLERRLEVDAKRAAVETLSNLQPCAPPGAEGAEAAFGLCPAASRRARQEALHAYLSLMYRSRDSSLDLSNTRLEQLSLSRVDLRDANLWGAHMRETDLQGADVRGANFVSTHGLQRPTRWCFDDTTTFPERFDPGQSDPGACIRSTAGG